MDKESKAYKYMQDRKCLGGDCTAKSEEFIYLPSAEVAAKKYAEEKIQEAIRKIQRQASINGIKGICAKQDVVNILKNMWL